MSENDNFLLESPKGYPAPAGILPAVSAFGSWRPSGHCRPHDWECSICGGSSRKTLVPGEIEVKPIVHGSEGGW